SAFTSNAQTRYSTTAFNSSLAFRADNAAACVSTTVNFTKAERPNMRFTTSMPGAMTWAPTEGLYTDAAGTVPYNGDAAATVYAKPEATTSYTITATSPAGCIVTASKTVNVIAAQTFYADTDGDGYGDAANTIEACVAPEGYVADN